MLRKQNQEYQVSPLASANMPGAVSDHRMSISLGQHDLYAGQCGQGTLCACCQACMLCSRILDNSFDCREIGTAALQHHNVGHVIRCPFVQ